MKLCGFDVGLDKPFFLIAGPCVIESRDMAFDTAGQLKEITARLGIPFIYEVRGFWEITHARANRNSLRPRSSRPYPGWRPSAPKAQITFSP